MKPLRVPSSRAPAQSRGLPWDFPSIPVFIRPASQTDACPPYLHMGLARALNSEADRQAALKPSGDRR